MKLATKRINEIFDAQLQKFPSHGMQSWEREILAIKTYLDEVAEAEAAERERLNA